MKRLLLVLVVAGVLWYVAKSQGWLPSSGGSGAASSTDPIGRARAAAAASDAQTNAAASMSREADQSGAAAGVTENMTPDQVRALLGAPDDVQTEALDSGARRETWTYRSAGKTVVFENGVAISIR
ncbi:MAG TPA: hypothetical protein VMN82_02135 [Thermoanaerobaculia bacterium]|nr:hypothetical protein [Thermoanaerobaculia bacterium]